MRNQYLQNPASVNPTLAQTALAVAAEKGNSDLFDKLQNVYETSPNPEFQEEALRMLAEFQNPALEERALNYTVSGKVRNQDAAIQFAIALQDPDTRAKAWPFIKSHWDQVHALADSGDGRDPGGVDGQLLLGGGQGGCAELLCGAPGGGSRCLCQARAGAY